MKAPRAPRRSWIDALQKRRGPRRAGLVIALDGPAGAGKSTSAQDLASVLGLRCIDTGAMYRGVAWAMGQAGISPDDRPAVRRVLPRIRLSFVAGDPSRLCVNGQDVSPFLRTSEVSQAASRLATVTEVRRFLVGVQRRMARGGGVVVEGRDIGTVVLPRADVKFFLDASVEERARRRWREQRSAGKPERLSQLIAAIGERDARDRTRAVSPLRAAPDAIVLDTTSFSRLQVKRLLIDWVRRRTSRVR